MVGRVSSRSWLVLDLEEIGDYARVYRNCLRVVTADSRRRKEEWILDDKTEGARNTTSELKIHRTRHDGHPF